MLETGKHMTFTGDANISACAELSKHEMTLAQTLDFFARTIRNGEPWSHSCQHAYEAALIGLHDRRPATASTEAVKRAVLLEAVNAVRSTPTKTGVTPDGYSWVRMPNRPEFIASIMALIPTDNVSAGGRPVGSPGASLRSGTEK